MLFVMQGAAGSGKSHVAAGLSRAFDAVIVSADSRRYQNGVYVYDPATDGAIHEATQREACDWMQQGRAVVVDNTNIKRWQCKPYVAEAVRLGIPVVFVRCTGEYPNRHGVPEEVVARMRAGMEDLTVASVLAAEAPVKETP